MRSKHMIALVLAVLILAACAPKEPVTPDAPEAPEYVYVPEYITLPTGMNNATNMTIIGDTMYFIGHFSNRSALYSIQSDGTNLTELPDYTSPDGTRPMALCADGDALWVVDCNTHKGAEVLGSEIYILRKLDLNGAEISRLDISGRIKPPETLFGNDDLEIDKDGNIWLYDGDTFRVIGPDGQDLFTYKNVSGVSDYYVSSIIRTSDDTLFVFGIKSTFDAAATSGVSLVFISPDIERGTFKVTRTLGNMTDLDIYILYDNAGDEKFDFYFAFNGGVFSYKTSNGEYAKLLDWEESGIDKAYTQQFDDVTVFPDASAVFCSINVEYSMFSIASGYDFTGDSSARLVLLKPVPRAFAATIKTDTRTAIRMATFGANQFGDEVARFNATNTEYRIDVTEYDFGGDSVTFMPSRDAITQFNTAIVGNSPPDIIAHWGQISLDSYTSKGVFEDLYPYLDAKSNGRETIVPQLLSAFESDGKLYQLPTSFSIKTVAGKTDSLGGRTSWTVSDILALAETTVPIPNKSAPLMLELLLTMNLGSFVDWQTGECYFTGDEFMRILEFAGSYPASVDMSTAYIPNEAMIRDGDALADIKNLGDFLTHKALSDYYGGVTYVGYPSNDGGSAFQAQNTVSISAASQHKDAAWEFIQLLLSDEFQAAKTTYFVPTFPATVAALNACAAAVSTPDTYIDADNVEVERIKGTALIASGYVDVYALTQDEVNEILSLIASITHAARMDYDMLNIITDEANAYFSGQRTATEAAQRIQNRVALFVSERG